MILTRRLKRKLHTRLVGKEKKIKKKKKAERNKEGFLMPKPSSHKIIPNKK